MTFIGFLRPLGVPLAFACGERKKDLYYHILYCEHNVVVKCGDTKMQVQNI